MADPMMSAGGSPMGGAPPPMPPPSDQEMMDARGGLQAEQLKMILDSVPTPTQPYKVATIKMAIKAMNGLADKVAEEDVPDIEWEPPGGEKDWAAPLPPQVYGPLAAIAIAASQIPEGEKYAFDPTAVTDDALLKQAAAQVERMAGDKKFLKALATPAAPSGPSGSSGGDAKPPPTGKEAPYDDTDMELMQSM